MICWITHEAGIYFAAYYIRNTVGWGENHEEVQIAEKEVVVVRESIAEVLGQW